MIFICYYACLLYNILNIVFLCFILYIMDQIINQGQITGYEGNKPDVALELECDVPNELGGGSHKMQLNKGFNSITNIQNFIRIRNNCKLSIPRSLSAKLTHDGDPKKILILNGTNTNNLRNKFNDYTNVEIIDKPKPVELFDTTNKKQDANSFVFTDTELFVMFIIVLFIIYLLMNRRTYYN